MLCCKQQARLPRSRPGAHPSPTEWRCLWQGRPGPRLPCARGCRGGGGGGGAGGRGAGRGEGTGNPCRRKCWQRLAGQQLLGDLLQPLRPLCLLPSHSCALPTRPATLQQLT